MTQDTPPGEIYIIIMINVNWQQGGDWNTNIAPSCGQIPLITIIILHQIVIIKNMNSLFNNISCISSDNTPSCIKNKD